MTATSKHGLHCLTTYIHLLQHVWALGDVLSQQELEDIVEAINTNPFLAERLKEARNKIAECSLEHVIHAKAIRDRLQPLFKGQVVEFHRARFQAEGGKDHKNVHQDPHLYVYRACIRISADGQSTSHIDFHAGQRKSNGKMKAGGLIATLPIRHGEVRMQAGLHLLIGTSMAVEERTMGR
jgi:hypothetical protein